MQGILLCLNSFVQHISKFQVILSPFYFFWCCCVSWKKSSKSWFAKPEITRAVICPLQPWGSLSFLHSWFVIEHGNFCLVLIPLLILGDTQYMQYFNISMSYREDADIRDAHTLIKWLDVNNFLSFKQIQNQFKYTFYYTLSVTHRPGPPMVSSSLRETWQMER